MSKGLLDPPIERGGSAAPSGDVISKGCERVPNLKYGVRDRRSLLSKRLIEILDQIVGMLETDRAS